MTTTFPMAADPSAGAASLSTLQGLPAPGASLPNLCPDGRLREDGSLYELATTDDGGALVLHPRIGVLVVYIPQRAAPVRVVRLGEATPEIWTLVAAQFGVQIGTERLPRYWLLEEQVSLGAVLYACYDLERWQAVGWTTGLPPAERTRG